MRLHRSMVGLALSAALAVGFTGCKSGRKAPQVPAEEARKVPQPLDPATLGDISGIVRFAGKAPAPIKIDTSMDPACGFSGGDNVQTEQYVINGDRLANVYVYVKSGPAQAIANAPIRTDPVALDQKGCSYVPHVIGVEVGEPVRFLNSDETMHNIHTMPDVPGNAGMDISEGPKGAPQTRTFTQPELMMPVRCNNHPWMSAYINVSATPWFAVTGPDGKFMLKGLPAGEYTLGAVQEKAGEQEIKVTVRPKVSTQADFTFALKPDAPAS